MASSSERIRGVIFDLDETIISSLETYVEAFNRGAAIFGLESVSKERIAHFLDQGYRLAKMLLELSPSVFQEDRNRQACEDEIRNAYIELEAQKVLLKPEAKRTLQSLKERGFKVGIVTGRMTEGEQKWHDIRRLGIHQYIDAMVTGAEAPPKPAPDGLIECVKQLGLSAEDCVFVGDSRVDVIAGKKAGVRTIAIHTGVADKKVLAAQQPDSILADLGLLFSCLGELQETKEEQSG